MHMNSDPRRRWYRPGPSRSRGFVKLMLARSAGIHVASSLLLASLALSLAPSPAGADPRPLADSTWTDSWKLPNGLRVVTRDIRGATGVAMTVAYGFGSDQDPTSREGWASLLAYVDFLSAEGEYPERTLDELASSRPLGWRIEVGPRYTRLTEVAKTEQLPGVLHQMALRLRQAAPSAKVLAAARKAVQAELAQNYRDNLANALHYGVPSVATADSGAALRYAGGKGIDGAALPDVQAAIRTWYVPANAVLSLAGNLSGSGIDVRRVIANEFGSIPAGSPAAFPPAAPMHPAVRIVDRAELARPAGVVAILAPALSDTAHPSFFLHALLAGSSVTRRWGRTEWIPSPFQYSLLDEPELVRFYPPVTPSDVDSSRIREEYREGLLALSQSTISFEEYRDLLDSVRWLLGGPLNANLRRRSRADSGVLAAISTTSAMRALWGSDEFWSSYLARFSAIDHPAFARWISYFFDPERQVQLIFVPPFLHKKG